MARAQGARSELAAIFESVYGTPPSSGYFQLPFAAWGVDSEQGLIEDDLLGLGRDPQDPSLDVINANGDVRVPVDLRNFGYWLRLAFGSPTTTQVAATGSIVFSDQPAENATITINGTAFTFVTGSPGAGEIEIGASLSDTVDNIETALNGSVDGNVSVATYAAADGTTINVTHDTAGTGGNAFTLAVSTTPASNATLSAATLTGGAYRHQFISGKWDLPSMSAQLGFPEVPYYRVMPGLKLNTMAFQRQRSGLYSATLGLIAQGSDKYNANQVGSPSSAQTVERFTQFDGAILKDGAALGNIVSANWTYSNNLDPVETIRDDGKIDGADETIAAATGQIVARFATTTLIDEAVNRTPSELSFTNTIDPGKKLVWTLHRVRFPKPKLAVEGPRGIQATFAWQAAKDSDPPRMCTVDLYNDVASYEPA